MSCTCLWFGARIVNSHNSVIYYSWFGVVGVLSENIILSCIVDALLFCDCLVFDSVELLVIKAVTTLVFDCS